MNVEQTTQLIQLILNSVLMSVVCALVLSGLLARLAEIEDRLQALHRQASDTDREKTAADLHSEIYWHATIQIRKQLRHWQARHRLSRYNVMMVYYALLFAGLSCFVLALRGLLDWNGLIPGAIALFVVSVAMLLGAISLTLIDLHGCDRPLLDEVRKFLNSAGNSNLSTRQRHKRSSAERLKYKV